MKHGHAPRSGKTKTYRIWKQMRDRCTNPNNPQWADYGGRGISRCHRWDSYINFLSDMGECPVGLTIDRIENDGNYEPGNCRWVEKSVQSRNTRRNRWVLLNGQEMVVKDAAALLGVSDSAIINIVKRRGLTYQEAIDRLSSGIPIKARGSDGRYEIT